MPCININSMMRRFTILFVSLCVLLVISNANARSTCGPVCDIFCEYGNVLDNNGCPTCECKKQPDESENPCGSGRAPLKDYNCHRSGDHDDCPSTYECVTAPDDSQGVCCSPRQSVTSSTQATI